MAIITRTGQSPHAKLDGVPVNAVTIEDAFWKPKIEINHTSTIPHQYAECERTSRIDNFRRAAERKPVHPSVKLSGQWGITAKDASHPIFAGLEPCIYLVSAGLATQDECCYWDEPKDVHGTWLADWEHAANKVVCGEYAKGAGKAIFIGTGAYYWYTAGGVNTFQANVDKLTGNILEYLGGGPVAFLGTAADAAGLEDEPKAALAWLQGHFDGKYLPFAAVRGAASALAPYTVAWWHLTGEPDMPADSRDPEVVQAMTRFIKKGGGVFLTGFAPQYLVTLGLEPTPPTTIRQAPTEGFRGIYFNDSDVYKWMEAAAFSLASHPDPELDGQLDALIDLLAAAQCDNGYLNSYYMFDKEPERWSDLVRKHELYCGGHMVQAAIAHHRVTGRTNFLNVATKWADLICDRFGPEKAPGAPGHPEPEMALVELYRETGARRYLDLASFFIEQRGRGVLNGSPYLQDHVPIREQTYVTGHAVRQLYLSCGVADVYAESGDATLMDALLDQWDDFVHAKMYVTGGAGARHKGEAFGEKYELPNDTAYAETCAAIASFMWNWRMLQITGEAQYADVMEQALYNGLLSGVSLDGKEYFYTNPLENNGDHRRTTKHFDRCACCPPNIARTFAALPGYLYGRDASGIYVHHYVQSTAEIPVEGNTIRLKQTTEYPWNGTVRITVNLDAAATFTLSVRWPGWANGMRVCVNDAEQDVSAWRAGSYGAIAREWQPGDVLALEFPMPVVKVEADPRVAADVGRIALMRGPIVYCLEQVDQPGLDLASIAFAHDAAFKSEHKADLLGGVNVLHGQALLGTSPGDEADTADVSAIPYFAWANREPGPMRVWIPYP